MQTSSGHSIIALLSALAAVPDLSDEIAAGNDNGEGAPVSSSPPIAAYRYADLQWDPVSLSRASGNDLTFADVVTDNDKRAARLLRG